MMKVVLPLIFLSAAFFGGPRQLSSARHTITTSKPNLRSTRSTPDGVTIVLFLAHICVEWTLLSDGELSTVTPACLLESIFMILFSRSQALYERNNNHCKK
jgi:hypothetical protein